MLHAVGSSLRSQLDADGLREVMGGTARRLYRIGGAASTAPATLASSAVGGSANSAPPTDCGGAWGVCDCRNRSWDEVTVMSWHIHYTTNRWPRGLRQPQHIHISAPDPGWAAAVSVAPWPARRGPQPGTPAHVDGWQPPSVLATLRPTAGQPTPILHRTPRPRAAPTCTASTTLSSRSSPPCSTRTRPSTARAPLGPSAHRAAPLALAPDPLPLPWLRVRVRVCLFP